MKIFLKILIFSTLLVFLIPAHLYRVTAFNIIVEISAIIYLLILIKNLLSRKNDGSPTSIIKITPIFIAFSLFIVANVLATIFSLEPYESFWGSPTRSLTGGLFAYLHYFIFFILLATVFQKQEDYLNLFKGFIFISFIVNFYGLYEGLLKHVRADSFFGNAIYLGIFSIFVFFISIYLFFISKNNFISPAKAGIKNFGLWFKSRITFSHIFYFTTAFFALSNIYLSLSRGPAVGLIGSLLIIGAAFLFYSIKKEHVKHYASAAIGLVILISAGFYFGDSSILAEKFKNIPNDPSVLNRLNSWKIANTAILERPLFGWGQENFDLTFNKYFNPKFFSYMVTENWFDRAHNNILDVGVASGFLGILTYLTVWIAAFLVLFYLHKKNNKKEVIIFGGLLTAYFISNLTFFDTLTTFIPFVLVLGFLNVNAENHLTTKKFSLNIGTLNDNRINWKIIIPIAIAILLIISVFINIQIAKSSYYYYRLKFQSDKTFNDFENYYAKILSAKPLIFKKETVYSFSRILSQTSSLIGKENFNKHLGSTLIILNELSAKNPLDIKPYYYGAELNLRDYEISGNENSLVEAENLIKRAIKISPNRQDLYQNLAQIYMSRGDLQGAIKQMEKARDLNPDYSQTHFYLSVLYLANNNTEMAEKELNFTEKLGAIYQYHDINNLIYWADYYIKLGKFTEADKFFNKALSFDTSNIAIRKKQAAIYLEMGDLDKARTAALNVLIYDPTKKEEVDQFIEYLDSL